MRCLRRDRFVGSGSCRRSGESGSDYLEQFKQNCSRFFGAAEVDLSRRQLGTYVLLCPGAANGPSPPPALPNQQLHLYLKCSSGKSFDGGDVDGGVDASEVFGDEWLGAFFDVGMADGAMAAACDGDKEGGDAGLLQGSVKGFSVVVGDALVGGAVESDEGRIVRGDVGDGGGGFGDVGIVRGGAT